MNQNLIQKYKQEGLQENSVSHTGYWKKNIRKTLYNWAMLNKLIFVMVIICGLCYVIVVNDLSIKGIVLEELKKDSLVLGENKKNFELKIMQLESYDNINRRAQEISMVKVDKIEYLTVGMDAVAMR